MRNRARATLKETNVDLTPMLDVVFILLIFFIVTSTFIQEKAIGIEPPPPPGPTPDSVDPSIIILVDADSLIRVDGALTDISGVRAHMERLRAESPDSSLIVQAHPAAKSGTIIKIRDEAYNANFDRVNVLQTAL